MSLHYSWISHYSFKVYSSLQAVCFSHLFRIFRFSTISLLWCIISFIYYHFYSNFEIQDGYKESIVKETAHEIELAHEAEFLPAPPRALWWMSLLGELSGFSAKGWSLGFFLASLAGTKALLCWLTHSLPFLSLPWYKIFPREIQKYLKENWHLVLFLQLVNWGMLLNSCVAVSLSQLKKGS